MKEMLIRFKKNIEKQKLRMNTEKIKIMVFEKGGGRRKRKGMNIVRTCSRGDEGDKSLGLNPET